jgi:hypothetical protein
VAPGPAQNAQLRARPSRAHSDRAEEIDQTLAESAARVFEAPTVVVREGGIVARCSFDDAPDRAAEDAKTARLITCCNELAASHETLAAAEDWRVAAIRGRNTSMARS